MSAVDPSQYPMIGLGRRFNPARDLSKTAFKDEDMGLYDLFMHHLRTGRSTIEGLTFTGCRIEGPAVMLILEGTTFDDTNFGGNGPVADLVLRPAGNRAIGSIPMRNCSFVGCEFYMLGFTGGNAILDQILAIPGPN